MLKELIKSVGVAVLFAACRAWSSGLYADRGITTSRIAAKTIAAVLPLKGSVPVAISYRTTPNENRSVRASSVSPRACSVDM